MSAQPYGATTSPARSSRAGAIALIIIGSVVALIAVGLLAAGGVLTWADRTQRDAAGYLTSPSTSLATSSYAIAATDLTIATDAPGWHVPTGALGSVRITATASSATPLFIGIASSADIQRYLDGVQYAQMQGFMGMRGGPMYLMHGGGAPAMPASQSFWRAEVSGGGTQSLTWNISSGHWAVVLMNADASQTVAADVSVGATAPFLSSLSIGLLIGGGVILLVAGALLFGGINMSRSSGVGRSQPWATPPPLPPIPSAPSYGAVQPPLPPPVASTSLSYPLRIEGHLDASPSRWLWLVKWLLLIPHYIVLAFLFLSAFVLTVIAFFAILFTGRYPRSIFDFNVGVLRWWWRVSFYSYSALGTDRYPPFTFDAASDYPATLEIPYPERLSRGLVLVKWWLLAIPHYIVLALLVGGTAVAVRGAYTYAAPYTGLITILVLIAAVALLFTGRYPRGIFELVMGLNRWVFRVLTYVLLLRDEYPPFRLDLGGDETTGTTSFAPAPPGAFGQPRPHGI
ncbi:MAG: DUF4389 domain-containing protein [Candidatus Dormiibacterota bacterium]